MKTKNISVVMVDGMTQFLKIEDKEETAVLVNVNKITTITEKLNGDIEISTDSNERLLLQGVSLAKITETLEGSDDYIDNDDLFDMD